MNQVLSALNQKKLFSLNENDLIQNIELHQENSIFLKNENNKGIQTIKELEAEIKKYQLNTDILSGNIQTLRSDLRKSNEKLAIEKKKKIQLITQLDNNKKEYDKLYDEMQNVKYRDICSYIIDYYICILNDEDYDFVMKSNYITAVNYILQEIDNPKYHKYKEILSEIGIDFSKLLKVLLDYKWEYNSVTHDSQKKEEEFIRLIKEFEDEETGEKF